MSADRLEAASRLKAHSRKQARRAQNTLRATVTHVGPLVVSLLEGEDVVDDSRIEMSGWMRHYISEYGLEEGDTALLHRQGSEYVFFDVLPGHDLERMQSIGSRMERVESILGPVDDV